MAVQQNVSLDDFILETMRIAPVDMCMESLEDLFTKLHLPDSLIQEHVHFSRDTYCRNLVCRTPRFDMLILGWRPGQVTTIHDHNESLNCTRVVSGVLTQRLFECRETVDETCSLVTLVEEEDLTPHSVTRLDRGGIHQMENRSDHEVVTLHIYSAPLRDITVYDAVEPMKEVLQLRYTLEDEFV